ncbi:restriction endonuclease subunit S [Jatrophihabitans fulvus]
MGEVSLGQVTRAVEAQDPARSGQAAFVYIDIAAVNQETKTITGARRLPVAEAPSRARQIVRAGDVLVSTVRPNLNAVARVGLHLDGATASTGFAVLRPSEGLDGRYLFHWVRSPRFVADMVRKATGASYPAVSDRIIAQSSIPLPAIDEQRRIADILDRADALSTKRRDLLALLSDLTQAVFLELFGNPENNPRGWPMRQLSDFIAPGDRINYGVLQPGDHVAQGVGLVRVGDLVAGRVRHSRLKYIDPAIESSYTRSRVRGNEVLVSCVGSIGVVAVARECDIGLNVARAVSRVPIESPTLREYIAGHLRTPAVQRYFTNELRTVAQPTLNVKQLAETRIMQPPNKLIDEYAEVMGRIDAANAAQVASRDQLDHLFASLQQRAFAGEL